LIEENLSLYSSLAKTKDVVIQSNLEDVAARLDLNTVSTVIRNLLSNAIKFSPVGDTVRITLGNQENYAEICFSDNGPGIKEKVKDQLHENEIYTSQKGSAGEKGFGLGLKLCNEFVRLNRGSLIIQSRPDRGTDIFVRFP
jgi:signal transduction histidine kinase